jgi:hypothetical protein
VGEDFGAAIGLFSKRLSPTIRLEIEGFIRLELDQESKDKYENMIKHIFEHYGPKDISDIDKLKSQLRNADDTKGYKHLFYTHRNIQNQLQKIYRRDATGAVINDPPTTGAPTHYGFTDEELRSILLMNQLGKTSDIFELIRKDALRNPVKTYLQIVTECENLLKDEKIEKSQPFNDPTSSYRSISSVGAATSNRDGVTCANRNEPSHYANNCRSKRCAECKYVFSTWQERHQHTISDHGSSNDGSFQRNNNFANSDRGRDRCRSRSNDRRNNYRSSSPYPTTTTTTTTNNNNNRSFNNNNNSRHNSQRFNNSNNNNRVRFSSDNNNSNNNQYNNNNNSNSRSMMNNNNSSVLA